MAQWNLERGLELANCSRAMAGAGRRSAREARARRRRARRTGATWPPEWSPASTPRPGRIEQFAGYFGLEDIDLDAVRRSTVPMDVVLGRERTQGSQVVKQADVVMLLALLPDRFDPQRAGLELSLLRAPAGHGSSLSRAMHAVVATRLGDVDLAERYFRETAATDLEDTTTGIAGGRAHRGARRPLAGGGARLRRARLDGRRAQTEPRLPADWTSLGLPRSVAGTPGGAGPRRQRAATVGQPRIGRAYVPAPGQPGPHARAGRAVARVLGRAGLPLTLDPAA